MLTRSTFRHTPKKKVNVMDINILLWILIVFALIVNACIWWPRPQVKRTGSLCPSCGHSHGRFEKCFAGGSGIR